MRRRIFIGLAACVILPVPQIVNAENCDTATIDRLKRECLDLLRSAEATLQTGRNLVDAGTAKYVEASGPAADCLQGGYDILKAGFKDCNPSSPGLDPAACIITVAGIPDTIEKCGMAIALVQDALRLMREAKAVIGAAGVQFSDSGGDEIAGALRDCGDPICVELAGNLNGYATTAQQSVQRDIDKLTQLEKDLNVVKNALTVCNSDNSKCEEIPLSEVPSLEGSGGQQIPPIPLP